MINPEPSGIVTPVRQLTDAEFADLKAKWLARHSAVNQVVVLPDPHYDPTFSQFIRSACCDAPVYQVEDFAAECLPVLCGSCGAIAGTPGREDVDVFGGWAVSYVTGGKTPQPVDPERGYTEPTEGPQTPSGVSSSHPVLTYDDIVEVHKRVLASKPRWGGWP